MLSVGWEINFQNCSTEIHASNDSGHKATSACTDRTTQQSGHCVMNRVKMQWV